jgi:hypothetical protein
LGVLPEDAYHGLLALPFGSWDCHVADSAKVLRDGFTLLGDCVSFSSSFVQVLQYLVCLDGLVFVASDQGIMTLGCLLTIFLSLKFE